MAAQRTEITQRSPDSVPGAPAWTAIDLGEHHVPTGAPEPKPLLPVVVDAGEQFPRPRGSRRFASITPAS